MNSLNQVIALNQVNHFNKKKFLYKKIDILFKNRI